MFIAKYQGNIYTAQKVTEGIELSIRGKEGISYKIVQENELEELYTVNFGVLWKEHEFIPSYDENNKNICLYIVTYSEFPQQNNFIMIDKGEWYKVVPIEECEEFWMDKTWYENGIKTKEEKYILSADEYIKSYYENVIRLY